MTRRTALGWIAACGIRAQTTSEKWRARNDHGNRYEGRIEIPVGASDLELLSFTGYREPFQAGDRLRVRFFLPGAASVVVQGRELRDDRLYWMESKPARWRAGAWNEFGPWPTLDVIVREGVALANLGVLVYPRGDTYGTVLPAVVYHRVRPQRVTSYSACFRPRATLSRVSYSVTAIASGKRITSGVLAGEKSAGEPFPIEIDLTDTGPGEFRLQVSGRFKNRSDGLVREYTFHHRPRVD